MTLRRIRAPRAAMVAGLKWPPAEAASGAEHSPFS